MTTQYDRVCRVLVAREVPGDFGARSTDVLEIPGGEAGFRVAFRIEKTGAREPNAAEVTISGLSEATRGALGQRGARPKLVVEAGYVERSGQIFVGDCRPGGIDSTREGPSWVTRLRAGDGERAYRWAHVSASFAAGVGAGEVVARCVEALGLGAGNLARHRATLDRERFGSGWCAYEPAARALDRTLANLGWAWSIQDGTVQLEPPTPEGVTAWVLSSDSGLLGSPEMTQPEANKPARLRAKALLNHAIKPGAHVEMRSVRYEGVYRVVKATHTGDTHGQEWFTEIEARPVQGAA